MLSLKNLFDVSDRKYCVSGNYTRSPKAGKRKFRIGNNVTAKAPWRAIPAGRPDLPALQQEKFS
ncbi:hypothetical protein [Paraburkholderia sp. J63]|uniref:hypothetical protein n=1 Tax=Paraburkholderia sp. J63 TaxID=2805434 RepID=UPI002ABD9BB3|nr:hypothetical protein [Paraburkholderia sp. J63]